MRLVETYQTLTVQAGEACEYVPGQRVVPENELENAAFSQIWEAQKNACFGSVKVDDEGFGKAYVAAYLLPDRKFNPLTLHNDFVEVVVYWLWENGGIVAYWSIDNSILGAAQSNQAAFPVVPSHA
jgi:hypothetical protein